MWKCDLLGTTVALLLGAGVQGFCRPNANNQPQSEARDRPPSAVGFVLAYHNQPRHANLLALAADNPPSSSATIAARVASLRFFPSTKSWASSRNPAVDASVLASKNLMLDYLICRPRPSPTPTPHQVSDTGHGNPPRIDWRCGAVCGAGPVSSLRSIG